MGGRRRDALPRGGADRLAELGLLERQGQARAGLANLTPRGLPRGDDRVVPRARGGPDVAARLASAGGAPPGRRGRPPPAARLGLGPPTATAPVTHGHALPLHDPDELAVPVRQSRSGARA